jgi:REP element-mobilizing transposase RayT
MKIQLKNQRKSFQALHKIYFWTAIIHNGYPLLEDDNQKEKIIETLDFLSAKKLVTIYAFVIMPNHIHVIWQQHGFYGKEMPLSTFMKKTARHFKYTIVQKGILNQFNVNAANKRHQLWKRDSPACELYSKRILQQKLDHIHANPVSEIGQPADAETHYRYSSACYYQSGSHDFGFLNDIYQRGNEHTFYQ